MTWVKLDDAFWRNRKIRRAWREPRAVGFYVMAITYSADHELDGRVDPDWVTDQLPHTRERNRVLGWLEDIGLIYHEGGGVYTIVALEPERRRQPRAWYDRITPAMRRAVAERHGAQPGDIVEITCAYCPATITIDWKTAQVRFVDADLDHVIPHKAGGKTHPDNLVPACVSCNRSKGSRSVEEWQAA